MRFPRSCTLTTVSLGLCVILGLAAAGCGTELADQPDADRLDRRARLHRRCRHGKRRLSLGLGTRHGGSHRRLGVLRGRVVRKLPGAARIGTGSLHRRGRHNAAQQPDADCAGDDGPAQLGRASGESAHFVCDRSRIDFGGEQHHGVRYRQCRDGVDRQQCAARHVFRARARQGRRGHRARLERSHCRRHRVWPGPGPCQPSNLTGIAIGSEVALGWDVPSGSGTQCGSNSYLIQVGSAPGASDLAQVSTPGLIWELHRLRRRRRHVLHPRALARAGWSVRPIERSGRHCHGHHPARNHDLGGARGERRGLDRER